MKQKLLSFLFARFIPNRTAVGLGLFVAGEVVKAFMTPDVCAAAPQICAVAGKAQEVLTPWLVIAGIRDKART